MLSSDTKAYENVCVCKREREETVIESEWANADKINWDYPEKSGLLTALFDSWEETNGVYNFTVWDDNLFLFLRALHWNCWYFRFIPASV